MKTRAADIFFWPDTDWFDGQSCEVVEQEFDDVSTLLGPDGRPLRYERRRIGFDLRRRRDEG